MTDGDRLLCLILAMRDQYGQVNVSECSRALGLEPTRTHRLVHTLEQLGYITRKPKTKLTIMPTDAGRDRGAELMPLVTIQPIRSP